MLAWCVFDDARELIVEIQHGCGGDDSKLFVGDLLDCYISFGRSKGLKYEVRDFTLGHALVQFIGDDVWELFKREIGQHCVQRIPPTESKGRKQTSFISVAVLPIPEEKVLRSLPLNEIQFSYMRGTGPGGQNRNKIASCVRAIYLPTKTEVVIDGRDQGKNKALAVRILTARVNKAEQDKKSKDYNDQRKVLGKGGRGETEKIRTYNFLESRAVDHRTGRKTSNLKRVMKGDLEMFW